MTGDVAPALSAHLPIRLIQIQTRAVLGRLSLSSCTLLARLSAGIRTASSVDYWLLHAVVAVLLSLTIVCPFGILRELLVQDPLYI